MKQFVSNFVCGIVIAICGYLLIANVSQIIYLNKHETFNPSNSNMKSLKEDIGNLEKIVIKINKIKSSNFSNDDLKKIKDNANNVLANAKASELLQYKKQENIYLKDILIWDLNSKINYQPNIDILNVLAKYTDNLDSYIKSYKYSSLNNMYQNTDLDPFFGYHYEMRDIFNDKIIEPSDFKVNSRILSLTDYVVSSIYIDELILEVGDADA